MTRRIVLILALCVTACPGRGDTTAAARSYLGTVLQDPARSNTALAILGATGDNDLAPLFEALARSSDERRRVFGTSVLAGLAKADAKDVLLERFEKDPAMAVRSEALAHLLDLKAISADKLLNALKMPNERIRCNAARALVRQGRGHRAADTLRELTKSRDPATACLARMSLLGMGHGEYAKPLGEVFADRQTPRDVLGLLLLQIAEEKIGPAAKLAESVAVSPSRPTELRVQAYKAMVTVSPRHLSVLRDAIRDSAQTVFRVNLLRILASQEAGRSHLESLRGGRDAIGALVRFELSRPRTDSAASAILGEALSFGHPVVIRYVLDRARENLDSRESRTDFYTQPLLKYIRSVQPDPGRMRAEHYNAARASTLLVDIGTPAAIAGLKQILAGRYSAIARAAAAGLLRSRNPLACTLARPLLKSPYSELARRAALVLGRFGDAAAAEPLGQIVAHQSRHGTDLVVLASWYLLKIGGEARKTAAALAKNIR